MFRLGHRSPAEILYHVRDYARSPQDLNGYPLALQMRDGSVVCGPCVRAEYRRISKEVRRYAREGQSDEAWFPVTLWVYYEGAPLPCEHGLAEDCLGAIESAYGGPYEDAV